MRLLERMAETDEDALRSLLTATGPLVHGLVLRIVGDAGAAEEVTADVYLQAWKRAASYDAMRGTPSSWLLALARSRAIDNLRRRAQSSRREEPLEGRVLVSRRPDPLEASAARERRERVTEALARLSGEQREAIEMAFFGGLSHTEIAGRLNQPLGTVKTRIRLGMLKLGKLLRQMEGEP